MGLVVLFSLNLELLYNRWDREDGEGKRFLWANTNNICRFACGIVLRRAIIAGCHRRLKHDI